MTTRRRTVLAAIGTALTTAGCLGAASPGRGDDTGDSPTDSPTETPTGTPTETPTEDARHYFDEPCPSFAETDRTVCNHTRSADDEVYLTVSSPVYEYVRNDDEVVTLPFTLHNESDQPFGFNPYAWTVKRQTSDGWEHVAPDVHPEPWTTIAPGETYKWVIATQTHPTPHGEDRQYPVVEDLDSGRYAFSLTGFLGDGDDPTRVECIALFDVAVMVAD